MSSVKAFGMADSGIMTTGKLNYRAKVKSGRGPGESGLQMTSRELSDSDTLHLFLIADEQFAIA